MWTDVFPPAGDADTCRAAFSTLWEYISDEVKAKEKDDKEKEKEKDKDKDDKEVDSTPAAKALAKAASTAHKLSWLWTPAPDASLRLFKIDFGSSAKAAKRFPLIAALLKHERRLPLIGCVADVLRWHAVLFRAFRGGLRREEATEVTNAMAIERLPLDQRPAAAEALDAFCASFNRSFVLVERLFECQANPYLYEDALSGQTQIDLSGAGGQSGEPQLMSPAISVRIARGRTLSQPPSHVSPEQPNLDRRVERVHAAAPRCRARCPISFTAASPLIQVLYSLPSMVAGAQDADGLCTVQASPHPPRNLPSSTTLGAPLLTNPWPARRMQLCNVLSAAHNELMDVLLASSTGLLPRTARVADAALPTISYQSSVEVMRQQLLSYSPDHDLLPLLAAHRHEAGSKGGAQGSTKGGSKADAMADEADGESRVDEGKAEAISDEIQSSFELPAIERALAHSVLARATQLVVHVHHFEYQG